jgi:beta-N-acetylhexosaminidase
VSRSLEELVSSLFVIGFAGTELTDELCARLDEGIGGVILFGRNIRSREQVGELVANTRAYARRSLLVAVDQEGGRVQRLQAGFTRIRDARSLAERQSPSEVEALGVQVGLELLSVGINWDFAPVLDVDTNPKNPVIGDRAFARDPDVVAEFGLAFARGLESVGVASCAKHFPGHGDTHLDSHLSLPSLPHDLARLHEIELKPFRAYAEARLASVMTAHVLFPELEQEVPATMSKRLLSGLLRAEPSHGGLGFVGLIVSDDLEMRAISDHYGPRRAAVLGLLAGVDTFLCCSSHSILAEAKGALVEAVVQGEVPRERLEDAAQRTLSFRERWQPRGQARVFNSAAGSAEFSDSAKT